VPAVRAAPFAVAFVAAALDDNSGLAREEVHRTGALTRDESYDFPTRQTSGSIAAATKGCSVRDSERRAGGVWLHEPGTDDADLPRTVRGDANLATAHGPRPNQTFVGTEVQLSLFVGVSFGTYWRVRGNAPGDARYHAVGLVVGI
jgi:hypothetical protein